MIRLLDAAESFLSMHSDHQKSESLLLRGMSNLSYEKAINLLTQGQTWFLLSSVFIKISRFPSLLNILEIKHFNGRAEEKFAAVSCRLGQGSSNFSVSLFNRRGRQSALGIQSRQIFGCICRSDHCATHQTGKIAVCCCSTHSTLTLGWLGRSYL